MIIVIAQCVSNGHGKIFEVGKDVFPVWPPHALEVSTDTYQLLAMKCVDTSSKRKYVLT